MKEFIAAFFTCLVICYIVTFFFAWIIVDNIWVAVTLIAFILSLFITVFLKQEYRIEELEKKMGKLLKNNQDL